MNTATAGVQPTDSGVAAALVSTMQQVGGAIGTAVLSTIVATATANYAASRPPGTANIAHVAATHGFSVAFAVSSALFALGAVMGASLFPSKTRIAELRATASAPAGTDAGVESPKKQAMADAVFVEV